MAALVEGEDEVSVLAPVPGGVDGGGVQLALLQKLALPGVRFPCHAAWDARGRLWVTGGPPLDASRAAHVGLAEPGPTEAGDGGGGAEGGLPPALVPVELGAVLGRGAVEALECRVADEEQQLADGKLVSGTTRHLQVGARARLGCAGVLGGGAAHTPRTGGASAQH